MVGFGLSGPAAIHFSVTHPQWVSAVILFNSYAHFVREDDYPWGIPREDLEEREAAARHEVKTTGDGFLVTFDCTGRALRCATDILSGAKDSGLDLRVGVHTGEVEVRGDDIAGLAVTIAKPVPLLRRQQFVWREPSRVNAPAFLATRPAGGLIGQRFRRCTAEPEPSSTGAIWREGGPVLVPFAPESLPAVMQCSVSVGALSCQPL
jgi:hypothetical protein